MLKYSLQQGEQAVAKRTRESRFMLRPQTWGSKLKEGQSEEKEEDVADRVEWKEAQSSRVHRKLTAMFMS